MTASFLLPRPSGLLTTLCVFACGLFTARAAESLPNLDEEKPNPRFAVTDRVWPSKPGEAHICLWKDDALAALSLTIDDNCGPDVPWWLEMAEKHSLPLTWFLITERIGKGNRFNLTWPDWVAVGEKGHALESHTAMHFHTDREGWDGVEWEYTQAIKDIEENVPGHRVHFLAYVGGKNSHLNSRELAAKNYAAARGTTGRINPPNATDYLNVSAMSNPNLGDGAAWSDLNGMFDPTHRGYRGWAVIIYHLVQDK
jgi:peptidoglycan/xylan/chitin deacetylase (PgdA/CDA1 family)